MNANGKFLNVILASLVIVLVASSVGIVFNAFSPTGIEIRPKPPGRISETPPEFRKPSTPPETEKAIQEPKEQAKTEPEKEISPGQARPDNRNSQTGEKTAAQPEKTVTAPAAEAVSEPGAAGKPPEAAPETKTDVPPSPIKENIDLRRTKELFDAGNAIFLDARPEFEYLEAHIKGALSLSESRFDYQYGLLKDKIKKDDALVVYCHGGDCNLSDQVADRLNKLGYNRVYVFKGGWDGWSEARYPIERIRTR